MLWHGAMEVRRTDQILGCSVADTIDLRLMMDGLCRVTKMDHAPGLRRVGIAITCPRVLSLVQVERHPMILLPNFLLRTPHCGYPKQENRYRRYGAEHAITCHRNDDARHHAAEGACAIHHQIRCALRRRTVTCL